MIYDNEPLSFKITIDQVEDIWWKSFHIDILKALYAKNEILFFKSEPLHGLHQLTFKYVVSDNLGHNNWLNEMLIHFLKNGFNMTSPKYINMRLPLLRIL